MRRLLPETLARGIYGLCRFLLGGIFIYAACLKINTPQALADSIASYHLVPDPLINLLALGLPLFEVMCGLSLLTGHFCATGLLSIISMLFLFLAALLSAIARGLPFDCGCFGAHSWLDTNPWISLMRDSMLFLCAIYAYGYRAELEMAARKPGEGTASSALP